MELGVTIFGCASTGNLGNSVAAHAARLGLHCYVFIPHDLEPGKVIGSAISGPHVVAIDGNYDDVNRLCTQVGDRYGWGFANINLRAYYAEGAKTLGFEIVEQLGWRFPAPRGFAGGGWHAAAAHRPRIPRTAQDWIGRGRVAAHPCGAGRGMRARGACPARGARASRAGPAEHHCEVHRDRQPGRRVPCLAYGAGNGRQRPPRRQDPEILEAIELLACTEGIFTEPAGGTTLAATRHLIREGFIQKDESVVVCITGNGYKTPDAVAGSLRPPSRLGRSLAEFEAFVAGRNEVHQQVGGG